MSRRGLTLVLVTLFFVLALMLPLPQMGRGARALTDLAHVPLFGFFALLVLWVGTGRWTSPRPWQAVVTWVVVVLFSGILELCQGFSGRSTSWQDLKANALGSGACLVWALTSGSSATAVRYGLRIAALATLAVATFHPLEVAADGFLQAYDLPELGSFEHARELTRWRFQHSRASRSAEHVTEGRSSLELDMGTGDYVGAAMVNPFPDWSAYRDLVFDLYLPAGAPLNLIVKIEDYTGDYDDADRFHAAFHLEPGGHQIRIPLSQVEQSPLNRTLDLRQIRLLHMFTVDPQEPRTIYFDNIHLEGEARRSRCFCSIGKGKCKCPDW